ncbi:MAG: hypothetical protein ABI373_05980, partial [Flavobacteriales bacterium]
MRSIIPSLTLLAGLFIAGGVHAQCDTIASLCEKNITAQYIPDGQFYRALLKDDETAEFDLTLYGGTTYRIAACSGTSDGNLVFSVYDKEHNLLFSNKDFNNDPYWDLVVANTLDVTVDAVLDTR